MRLPGLKDLLAPFDEARFRAEFLERQPLHVRRDAAALPAGLPDLDAIEQLIDYGALQSGRDFRAMRDGELAPGELNPTRARTLLRAGHTIVVNGVGERFASVAALCRGLELDLGCDVRANLYVSPPGTSGREPHYDLHDVVLLQLSGAKAWTVHAPQLDLPLESQRGVVDEQLLAAPLLDMKLRPGDLLYMPRGTIHRGTSEGLSVHLTIGLHFYRWANFLADAIHAAAKRDVALRRAVPQGSRDVARTARELLQSVADGLDADALLGEAARDRLERMAPLTAGWLRDDPHDVAPDSVLARRVGQPCIVDGSAIHLPSRGGMRGPPAIAPALRFIADAEAPFRPVDLPGHITETSKVVICRRLMREGLLTFYSSS